MTVGITGFHPLYLSGLQKVSLADLQGKRAAVDVSGWIYEVLEHGKKTVLYRILVKYAWLKKNEIEALLVFDGPNRLPAKEPAYKKRDEARKGLREEARILRSEGKEDEAEKRENEAEGKSQALLDYLFENLRAYGIPYMVAPYEADAQISHLFNLGLCDLAITADSDFVAYGIPLILYKFSNGEGLLFKPENFPKTSFRSRFDLFWFRAAAILTGCDYFSLPHFGAKAAAKMYTAMVKSPYKYSKMVTYLCNNGFPHLKKEEEEEKFREGFDRAWNTFHHHFVYNPITNECEPLHPFELGETAKRHSYLGDLENAKGVYELSLTPSKRLPRNVSSDHYCLTCETNYDSQVALDDHRRSEHLTCHECGRIFRCEARLRDHTIQAHSTNRPFKCTQCSLAFSSVRYLDVHRLARHANETFVCRFPNCKKAFNNKYRRTEHERVHTDQAFKCDICGKAFAERPKLTRHLRVHSGEARFKCEVSGCDEAYKIEYLLRRHLFDVHGQGEDPYYKCQLCPYKTADKRLLAPHVNAVHPDSTEAKPVIKPHQCNECQPPISFTKKVDLVRHMWSKHGQGEDPRNLKCPHCDYRTYKNQTLQRHIKSLHSQS